MPKPDHERPSRADTREASDALGRHVAFLNALAADDSVPHAERLQAIALLVAIAGSGDERPRNKHPHEPLGPSAENHHERPRKHAHKTAAKKHARKQTGRPQRDKIEAREPKRLGGRRPAQRLLKPGS